MGVLLALPLTAAGRVWLDYILKQRGVSLSPVEPEPESDPTDQPFAPDLPEPPDEPDDEEPRGPSLIALAGRRPRDVREDDGEAEGGMPEGT
jgi:hypothetical protein